MLNGSPAAIDVGTFDDFVIARTKVQSRLHEAVGYEAMLEHRFLRDDRGVQQTTFANGVTVRINQSAQRLPYSGAPGIAEREFDAGATGEVPALL